MIWDLILDNVADTLLDSIKLLPFLFFTYLVMEYLEHETSGRIQNIIRKSGKGGPVVGGILGIFPQCGFSTVAANLYAGRIITLGTLITIFLSTSDEMLPVMISQQVPVSMVLKVLAFKVIIAMVAGFVIDTILGRNVQMQIGHLCEQHHCHCEKGIFRSALKHTVEILLYIVVLSFILNMIIGLVGEDVIESFILNRPVMGPMISSLVGLIPNCAASVIITQLYLEGILNGGSLIAGLLTGSGVGLLVLFRVNDSLKDNIKIVGLLYAIGAISGIVVELLKIAF